jgi:hypothetical protein
MLNWFVGICLNLKALTINEDCNLKLKICNSEKCFWICIWKTPQAKQNEF